MAFPKIVMHDTTRDREIILLSGFRDEAANPGVPVVDAEDKLQQALQNNPDAVAFGYVAGEWVAGA